jgi:hypothetical protein
MINDEIQLGEARASGDPPTVANIVEMIRESQPLDAFSARAALRYGPELVQELRPLVAAPDESQSVRLAALWLMARCGGNPEWTYLLQLLESGDRPTVLGVLGWLGGTDLSEPPQELLAYARHDDEKIRERGWQVVARHQVPGWQETLEGQLHNASARDALSLCRYLAPVGSQKALLHLKTLESPDLRILGDLCAHLDTQKDALELARRIAGKEPMACQLLAEFGDKTDVPRIEAARESVSSFVAHSLEAGLLRIQGSEAVDSILERLASRTSLDPILAGLSQSDLVDSRIVDAILALETAQLNYQSAYDASRILLRHGVERTAFPEIWSKTLKSDQEKLNWLARGLELTQVVCQLMEMGVIPTGPVPEVSSGVVGQWAVIEALERAGYLYWDDSEAGSPPFYPAMLDRLQEISRGHFQPEYVYQSIVSEELWLQFVQGGQLFKARMELQDDWADIGGLLSIANRALQEAEAPVRFRCMHTSDQNFAILCAPPDTMETASREGLIRF